MKSLRLSYCSNGVEPGSDLNIQELRDAIQDTIQAKMELQRQLTELCSTLKQNAEKGDCRNVEAFCSDLQDDDLQVLDLYMTVDEVHDECVADVEMEERTVLMKRLEGLESLEKTLKMWLTKKTQAEKLSSEEFRPAVDEICQTARPVEGERTETDGSGTFPKVFDSGVEVSSADSENAESGGPETGALSGKCISQLENSSIHSFRLLL